MTAPACPGSNSQTAYRHQSCQVSVTGNSCKQDHVNQSPAVHYPLDGTENSARAAPDSGRGTQPMSSGATKPHDLGSTCSSPGIRIEAGVPAGTSWQDLGIVFVAQVVPGPPLAQSRAEAQTLKLIRSDSTASSVHSVSQQINPFPGSPT